jgi:hypothetical protein
MTSSPSSVPAEAPRPAPERSGTRRPVGDVIGDCFEADAEAATQLEGHDHVARLGKPMWERAARLLRQAIAAAPVRAVAGSTVRVTFALG